MRASEFTLVEGIDMRALAQKARQLLAQGMTEQQVVDALVKQGIPARLAAQAVQMAQMSETVADQLTQENQPSDVIEKLKAAFKGKSPVSDKVKYGDTAYPQDKNKSVKEAPIAATDDPSYNVDEEFAGAKVGHKAGPAGQLKAKAKVNVKGTVLGSPEKSQKGLRGKLVGGSMEEELEQLEERRRKRRKARRASYGPGAWGPGPYGGYGFDAGYSGDMGGGGDGGGGESIEHENFADGKNPQDKGDAKRHGVNTKASVSSLRKTAKQGGRKGQLAHWMANMKSGKAKKK